MAAAQSLLIIGGNGFLGSAVARAAVARGWTVNSLSRSGTAPTMPDGTVPAYTSKVAYHPGSALDPSSYAHLLPASTAVVHTLGVLFEGSRYKEVLGGRGLGALGGGLGGNPLERRGGGGGGGGGETGTYESVNRDSALAVLAALRASHPAPSSSSSAPAPPTPTPTPFVYISAEDVFRPFVDARYIDTKREAEGLIFAECARAPAEGEGEKRDVRPLVVRPGVMTSPTYRPLLAPLAPLLALSAALPPVLPAVLRALPLAPSPAAAAASLARALQTRALDVDAVGEAVCRGIEVGRGGVLGVDEVEKLSREGSVIQENRVW